MQNEGAKFWFNVFTDLKNRGGGDILIACCDGVSGFPHRRGRQETALPSPARSVPKVD